MGEMIKNDDILSDNLYPGVIGRVSQTLSTMVPCPHRPHLLRRHMRNRRSIIKVVLTRLSPHVVSALRRVFNRHVVWFNILYLSRFSKIIVLKTANESWFVGFSAQ